VSVHGWTGRRRRLAVFLLQMGSVCVLGHGALPVAEAQSAQAPVVRVSGRVADASGAPVPGASVSLTGSTTTPTGVAETAADGTFRIEVVPGLYTLRVSATGYATLQRQGVTVSSSVDLGTVTLQVAATSVVAVSGRQTFADLTRLSSQDALVGIADAASSGVITARESTARARRRPADALEAVPGLAVSQHSGEGKANQYYVRGFNLDHGTDLALSVAGMPVNLPTHGHGQGYADLNFLIPELVGSLQYRKGTYAADTGDFSAAGTIRINYLNQLEAPLARLEGGMFGYGRVLAAASPRVGDGRLLVAAEGMVNDGPWERPDAMRRGNAVVRYSRGTPLNGVSVTGLWYSARWFATDQIPRRLVDTGALTRFGTLDRTSGGDTHRLGVTAEWQRTSAAGITRVTGYGFSSGLLLHSNFTYRLDAPDEGDQFAQRDHRQVFGGSASRTWAIRGGDRPQLVTVGTDVRHDAIGDVGLARTAARRRLFAVRDDRVGQTSGAGWAQWQSSWSPYIRSTLGVRGDLYRWRVDAGEPANAGERTSGIVNPKASVAFGPWKRTELYLSAGGGFHSNDGRGTTMTRDPLTGDAVSPVDPLARARGAEVGLRTTAWPGLHMTVALWGLGLASELVFVGDAGTTTASRPSARRGVEWDLDYAPTPWLSIEGSLALSRARFTDEDEAGAFVPGAASRVAQLGAVLSPQGRWSGAVRWRHFGPRALVEDNTVRSADSNLVSLDAGVRISPRLTIRADVLNAFNSRSSDIDYFYTSRVAGEPAQGVDDVHVHPVEPFTVRLSLVLGF
jgi:hypothetical protein